MMTFNSRENKLFWTDKLVRTAFIFAAVAIVISLAWLYWHIKPSRDPIALRYSLYFGVDLIGVWWQAFLLPLVSLVIVGVNFVLAKLMYLKAKILAYFLALVSALLACVLLITSVLISVLNS